MNRHLKPFSELHERTLRFLYSLRLYEDKQVPYEEYISRYNFIIVNGIAYHTEKCEDWRIKEYFASSPTSSKRTMIPDAIETNGLVMKNRFGHNSMR